MLEKMMQKSEILTNKAEIVEYYCKQKHTREQCAQHFKITLDEFKKWLRCLGITKYPPVEITADDLYQYYLAENHTLKETAVHFQTSCGRLTRKLKKLGIRHKTTAERAEVLRRYMLSLPKEVHAARALKYQKTQKNKRNGPTKDELFKFYVIEGNSRPICAKKFNISLSELGKLIKEYDIKKAPAKVQVSKEDFYEYFITQNHTFQETAEHFRISKNQAVNLGRRYNIKKPSYLFSAHVTEMNNTRWANCTEEELETFKQKISATKQALSAEVKRARAASGYVTRKKNGTMTSSSPEERTYTILCDIYGDNSILRWYKSEEYPFHCDFFIKPLQLYLELNFHWTHGKHVFNEVNVEDLKKLETWKQRAATGSSYYARAIEVWTVKDPLKLKIAKENNLNYLAIYSQCELDDLVEYLRGKRDE